MISAIVFLFIFTYKASFLNLLPLQSSHSVLPLYLAEITLLCILCFSPSNLLKNWNIPLHFPFPFHNKSISSFDKSWYSLCIGKLYSTEFKINLSFHLLSFKPDQQLTTPPYTDCSLSLITLFLSIPKIMPKPSHLLHAPYGLLKANKGTEFFSNVIPSSSNLFEKG